MVAWSQLVLPALLSAVLVFVASSLVHMVLKWHNPDYRKLPEEDAVRAVLRGAAPGQYILPHCLEGKEAGSPEMTRKFEEGPVAVVYVKPSGSIRLGPFLGRWVLYALVVSLLAGYLARATLGAGAPGARVFQVAGAAAWLAYAWQGPAESIWKGKPWSVTAREMLDGLVYAAATGGAYAWLWPAA